MEQIAQFPMQLPIVMVVQAPLSHYCPLAAIVFAFGIDERTVAGLQFSDGLIWDLAT